MADLVLLTAVAGPVIAVLLAIVVYLRRRAPISGTGRRSAGLFVIGVLGAGSMLGYLAFLYLPWPLCEAFAETLGGTWCGLTAYLAGPLGFIVGTLIFSAIWSFNGMRPNSAIDSDTLRSPPRAPHGARHRGR
jgi:hypothetical protein